MKSLKSCLLITFFTSFVVASAIFFIEKTFALSAKSTQLVNFATSAVYMWIPGLVVLGVTRKDRSSRPSLFQKPNKVTFLAVLIPIAITVLSFLVCTVFGKFSLSSLESMFAAQKGIESFGLYALITLCTFLVTGVVCGVSINAFFAYGEEILWREYLWKKVACLGFAKACVAIGVIWGLWHAPLIVLFGHNYPTYPLLGVVAMVLWCTALTPLLILVRVGQKSMMNAAIFHGTINAILPAATFFFPGGNPYFVGPAGLGALVSICLVNLCFIPKYRKLTSSVTKTQI